MSKGHERHKARQEELAALGRALARRAKSSCELCEASGVPLAPYEVPPVPAEPDLDGTLLVCEECRSGAAAKRLEGERWRFLENAVWSEFPATQVVAVRMLRRLADAQMPWAVAAADVLYLAPEIEGWVEGKHPDDQGEDE